MELNITTLKLQLSIETTYTSDDTLLKNYLDIAVLSVYDYCGIDALSGYTLSGYTDGLSSTYSGITTLPITIIQAIIMLATHLYLNRTIVSFAQGYKIPLSFEFLLEPYKNYTVC
jgi:hypothetical protein